MSDLEKMRESKQYMRRLIDQKKQAWTKEDLDSECAAKYGPRWVWHPDLQCCVNDRVKPTVFMPLEKKATSKRVFRIKV
jgi:hypothetical protein